MSDTYNYSAGAVHHDHHRSITLNGVSGRDLQALLKAFMDAEADDAEVASADFCPVGAEQGSMTVHEPLPEVLLTDQARALHAKLVEAGMVDERWRPVGLSFTEKGTLIDYVAERLDIRAKWKVFGTLWGTDPETLRTSKARGLDQDKTWAFRSRLEELAS